MPNFSHHVTRGLSPRRSFIMLGAVFIASITTGLGYLAVTGSQAAVANKNCLVKPSACGFPDATNTGVPAGTKLTVREGTLKITVNGTVIDKMDIRGNVQIYANDVVIKNSKITGTSGGGYANVRSFTNKNTKIYDSTIVGTGAEVAVGSSNMTLTRVNITGNNDGVRAGHNFMMTDSYVHDLGRLGDYHPDTVQTGGGVGSVIRHNTLTPYTGKLGEWAAYVAAGSTGTRPEGEPHNAALQMGNITSAELSNFTFTDNLLNGGNCTIQANWSNVNAGTATASGINISGNRMGHDTRFKDCAFKNVVSGEHGVTLRDNVWDDTGSIISQAGNVASGGATVTPVPTRTATPTPVKTATPTPVKTATPTPTATKTPVASASPTTAASPSKTPAPTSTATPTGQPSATPVPTGDYKKYGDLNADRTVNALDLSVLLTNWGKAAGDTNGDGTTNVLDLSTLVSNWGRLL